VDASARLITTLVPLDHTRNTFGAIALSRSEQHGPFDGEDLGLVRLFHGEMAWVYDLDLPLASPEMTSLPPRARETLQYLLAGLSEKQAADRLELSHNTVHHYVKLLYRHFEVSSRSELLARWVRDPHAGTPPTPLPLAPPIG
jgi:DNA-binding CsgD family transcriptional regulator